jgi:hypothetical protein
MATAAHDVVVRSYDATVFQGLDGFPIAPAYAIAW